MHTMDRYRRLLLGLAGVALVAVGLSGLSWTWQSTPVFAQSGDGGSHETMHEMMDSMHGEGTAARMHELEGGEEMMQTCGSMMDMMSGMSGMRSTMGGRGMSDMDSMMRGLEMSNMGSMMGSR